MTILGNPHVRFDEGEVAPAATPRRGFLLYTATVLHFESRRKIISRWFLLFVFIVLFSPLLAFGYTCTWTGPTSVSVGQKFLCYATLNGTQVRAWIDESASSADAYDGDSLYYWKAGNRAGTIVFFVQWHEGSMIKESTRSVTVVDPDTLSYVKVSVSSPVCPGGYVWANMVGYTSSGKLISGSLSSSWSLLSERYDSISQSGCITLGTQNVARTLTITGTGTYKGITKQATATLKVVPYTYTIKFSSAGTGMMDDMVALVGKDEILPPNEFSYQGFVFSGWDTNQTGVVVYSDSGHVKDIAQPNTTITLYAVWKPLPPVFTPESGTSFGNSLTVSLSCQADGASIHYTTDGSEPTVDSTVYKRFRINGKTTVRAIAAKDGLLSDVVTAEYALGQCDDPVIAPCDGSTFKWAGEQVSINWQGKDGVLRYTTDGSDPTVESPVYEGSFTISDTTVVKAKAFGDQFFDSAVVTANITRVWTDVATPQIEAANSFIGSKNKVVISCSTKGSVIHYTLDGSEPNSHSTQYAGPFYVSDSCTVKACAVKYDYRNSAVATQEVIKVWAIGDTLGKPDHKFTTTGDSGVGWIKVDDATAPNGEAMRSGSITDSQSSVLSTTVTGSGRLSFSWRTSCEDSGGQYDWDHVEFAVDGTVRLRSDGINSWTRESVRINGDGVHMVTWTYKKDDVESDGDDAAYVAGYEWASDYVETKTTAVPVPYAWLLQHDSEIVDEFDAYETAAKVMGENGYAVWGSYVLGLNPNDKDSVLRITEFPMKADGTPDLERLDFKPAQDEWNVPGAHPVIKGAATFGGEWQPVTEENKSQLRFFKVEVVLP